MGKRKITHRILSLLLATALCLPLAACGRKPSESNDSGILSNLGVSDATSTTASEDDTTATTTTDSAASGRQDGKDPAKKEGTKDTNGKVTAPIAVNMKFAAATKAQDARLNANPSRGWRTHLSINVKDALRYKNINAYFEERAQGTLNVSPDVATTVFSYIYLTDYRGMDLPKAALDAIDKFFAFARKRGFTVLLTFAYCDDLNNLTTGADQDTILRHIKQLKPIVEKNKDTIHVIKQGFVGAYGEWAQVYQRPAVDYATITKAIVENFCLPTGLRFTHRLPEYKNLVKNDKAVYSVIGFGNDAIYGEQSRKGWESGGFQLGTEAWTQVSTEGAYNINDGEMCPNRSMHEYTDPTTGKKGIIPKGIEVIAELGHHWFTTMSVWHGMYDDPTNDPIMNHWKEEKVTPELLEKYKVVYDPSWFKTATGGIADRNCYEFIRDHLGYRIGLQSLKFAGDGKTGSTAQAELKLKNFGFAAAYRMNSGFAVLDENYDMVSTVAAGDPEKWYSHNPSNWQDTAILEHTVKANVKLPNKSGKYYLAFYMKNGIDMFARMANQLDMAGGYNVLCEFTVQ